ncbi:MAG: hypothetical protein K2Q45_00340 [Nitrosomonas sp.]|nr:hypothetical protein [Nitrosomonas sp.]
MQEGCSQCGLKVKVDSWACVNGVCWLCFKDDNPRHVILANIIKEACPLEDVRLKSVSKEGRGIVLYYKLNGHLGCFAQQDVGNYNMTCCMQGCDKNCKVVEYEPFTKAEFAEQLSKALSAHPEYKEGGCCMELLPLFHNVVVFQIKK